jgi:hypothetical protein
MLYYLSLNSKQLLSKFILTSAPFALFLSIIFFWIQILESNKAFNKTVNNLNKIEKSLSTRYIGIFPNYLPQINELLENVNSDKSIVIFQDVLYYGVFSSPKEFKKLTSRLIELSDKCKISIAYYDINSRVFRRSVQESRIKQIHIGKIDRDRLALVREIRPKNTDNSENVNI